MSCQGGYLQHSNCSVNNTEPYSYYSPFIFSAWCVRTDQIDLCDKYCKRASPGGLSYWLCLRFSRWSLNGTIIDQGNDYRRRMSGGSLIISNLDKDQDTGVYQCTAFNTWGSILSRRASLQFACKWYQNCKHTSVATLTQLWHSVILLCPHVCHGFVAQAAFFKFSIPISHTDCLQIDFGEGKW